jgi:cytolysin (calcineurin-like family phosphatase)
LRLQKGLVDHVSANGLHYSWNWNEVHFVQLNLYPGDAPHSETRYSAAYHDPQGSLAFLKADLAANVGESGQPVVIAHHYDLQGTDWWHEEERKAYYEAIKPYNVIVVFHGHTGTGVYRWKPDREERALDVVNTGQTENGFFVVQVTRDRVRLAYRAKTGITIIKESGGERRQWEGTWGWRHTFATEIEIPEKQGPHRR